MLRQLAEARKVAFAERQALQAKFATAGGRQAPTPAANKRTGGGMQRSPPQEAPARVVAFSSDDANVARRLAAPSPRDRALNRKAAAEAEMLRQLAEARKVAFAERQALQAKFATAGGRQAPTPAANKRTGGGMKRSPPSQEAPARVAASSSNDDADVARRLAAPSPSPRDRALNKKKAAEAEMLRQLAEARKAAFAERQALQAKFAGQGARGAPTPAANKRSAVARSPPQNGGCFLAVKRGHPDAPQV